MSQKLELFSVDDVLVAELPLKQLTVAEGYNYRAKTLVSARELTDTLLDTSLRNHAHRYATSAIQAQENTIIGQTWQTYTSGPATGGYAQLGPDGLTASAGCGTNNYFSAGKKESDKMNQRLQQIIDQKQKVRQMRAALRGEEMLLENLIAQAKDEQTLAEGQQAYTRAVLEEVGLDGEE